MNNQSKFALAVTILGIVAVQEASAVTVFGLSTRNQLVRFDSSNPTSLQQASFISGLQGQESLLGIDFRPANNVMYGLGSFGSIYTINMTTAQATRVGGLFDASTLAPIQLMGTEFGVDFNPVPDRLRVTSNLGQNLRINVATGSTIVDGTLNQSSGSPYIVASAYTNNDNNPATGTTLYNIDSARDMLTIQNPPNNGTQVDVGWLGTDVTALSGFDIYTVGATNTAFAAFQIAGTTGSRFATVNLGTGAATFAGMIGGEQSSDSLAIRDIAVQPVPEPATLLAMGAGLSALVARRRKKNA